MITNTYQHWQLEVDSDGIAWATLDKAGESTNSLSSVVMNELGLLLDQLETYPPKGSSQTGRVRNRCKRAVQAAGYRE